MNDRIRRTFDGERKNNFLELEKGVSFLEFLSFLFLSFSSTFFLSLPLSFFFFFPIKGKKEREILLLEWKVSDFFFSLRRECFSREEDFSLLSYSRSGERKK